MGWKSIRDHYAIEHIVKLIDGDVHVGSAYVGDLVVVKPDGRATVNRAFDRRGELARVADAIEADPGTYRRLLAAEDAFARSIPVYTWEEGRIVEHRCEETGWPNVTHSGALMHDNRFFADRAEALEHALRDAEAGVAVFTRHVSDAEAELERRRGMLARAERELRTLRDERP